MTELEKQWVSLIKRLRLEAMNTLSNNKDGLAIIRANIVMDANGTPQLWVIPEALRVEPSGSALGYLLQTVTDALDTSDDSG